jgi:hypothetical protein
MTVFESDVFHRPTVYYPSDSGVNVLAPPKKYTAEDLDELVRQGWRVTVIPHFVSSYIYPTRSATPDASLPSMEEQQRANEERRDDAYRRAYVWQIGQGRK